MKQTRYITIKLSHTVNEMGMPIPADIDFTETTLPQCIDLVINYARLLDDRIDVHCASIEYVTREIVE